MFDPEIKKTFHAIRPRQIAAGFFNLIFVGSNMLMLRHLQVMIDTVIAQNYDAIPKILLRLAVLLAVLLVSMFLYQYHFQLVGQISQFHLMDFLFGSTLKRGLSLRKQKQTGVLSSMISTDSKFISDWKGPWQNTVFGSSLLFLAAVGMLLYYNVWITFAILATLAICFFFVNRISKRLGELTNRNQELTGEINQHILQSLTGINEITQLQKESYFANHLHTRLFQEKLPIAKRIGMYQSLYFCIAIALMMVLPVLSVMMGVYFITQGQMTVGSLLAVYAFTGQLQEPIRMLSQSMTVRQQALAMQKRIRPLYEETAHKEAAIQALPALSELHFQSEYYAFDEEHPLLKNLDLRVKRGDTVVVKGESGSGKSTLGNLIMRFLDPAKGNYTLRWNGTDVEDTALSAYFNEVLQAQQHPFVFEGTIRENLTLGDTYSEEDIREVMYTAGLEKFLADQSLDYQIAEGGKNLSGGQMQRIGLARTLLRKPQLLVLDEPTSALNETLGDLVSKRIQQFAKAHDMTLIVISHKSDFDAGNRVLQLQ